ncbi:hypothetical protein [Nonomuraea ceibae]|nr:hypothetical protein [Nonomuraea ceibae]
MQLPLPDAAGVYTFADDLPPPIATAKTSWPGVAAAAIAPS